MLFLESKIIHCFEQSIDYSLGNLKQAINKNLILSISLYLLLFSIIFALLEFVKTSLFFVCCFSLILYVVHKTKTISKKNFYFLYSLDWILYPFLYICHQIIPNKRERESEVIAYFDAQIENESYVSTLLIDLRKKVSYSTELIDKYKKMINQNLPLFVKENFKSSKALTRYLSENIKNEDGSINEYLLFFILLIPHRKTMEFDNIRAIIQSALQHSSSLDLYRRYNLIEYIEKPEEVSEKFKLYTIEKIKSLLTKSYSPEDFARFLSIVLLGEELSLEAKTISSIIKTKSKKVFNDKLFLLEKNIEKIEFKVLSNYAQYETTRKDFKNCIVSYFERDYDIVTCYINKEPIACISIQDSKVIEIKAPNNKTVHYLIEDEIRLKINQCLS